MSDQVEVSVILPVRNEGSYIAGCLDSLLRGTYPLEKIEIIVIDGCSEDETTDILTHYEALYPGKVRLFSNTHKTVPFALNIGIREAKGKYIARVDGHSSYPPHYLAVLKEYIDKDSCIGNVGCGFETTPCNEHFVSRAIAISLRHPFGVGSALFRTGVKRAIAVDTVPYGFFRRDLFDECGFFNEELTRNQDDEFNHRIRERGYKILLIPEFRITYFARRSFQQLRRKYFQYGLFKPLTLKGLKRPQTLRQFIPLLFISLLAALFLTSFLTHQKEGILLAFFLLGVYGIGGLLSSFHAVHQAKETLFLVPYVFFSFIVLHFSYGFGYLSGILRFYVFGKKGKYVPLSR